MANIKQLQNILNNINASNRIGTDTEAYLQTVENSLRSIVQYLIDSQSVADKQQDNKK